MIGDSGAIRAVDGNLFVVGAKSVTMGVRVREESALEHSVVRDLDTWNEMSRSEGALLSLSEEVFGVLVEDELTNRDKRIITMRDNLGDIVDVVLVCLTILFGDELDVPSPRGEVTLCDVLIEILSGVILV